MRVILNNLENMPPWIKPVLADRTKPGEAHSIGGKKGSALQNWPWPLKLECLLPLFSREAVPDFNMLGRKLSVLFRHFHYLNKLNALKRSIHKTHKRFPSTTEQLSDKLSSMTYTWDLDIKAECVQILSKTGIDSYIIKFWA